MSSLYLRKLVSPCLVVLSLSFNHAHATMSTAGQFAVSESGAATYSIPIQVPPGISGVEPKLSLNYNSQSGNSQLGMGWSLGGLSSISRCPRTMAQDGAYGSVNYDYNDRFCLDGQRLIAVSGTYGASGTVYRTERDNYSKIVSYGQAGNGPAWFKVWTKSGQIIEYGNTGDSRIEAQGKPTAITWAMNRVQDVKGNYLTASYVENNGNGEFYISRIDYTGNANAGVAPSASVQFTYAARSDVVPQYYAGSLRKSTVILSSIKTFISSSATPVRDYALTSSLSADTKRSRITNIKECDGAGICMPAIQLNWLETPNAFVNAGTLITGAYPKWISGVDAHLIRAMDVNGDGLQDIVIGPDEQGNWGVLRSTGNGFVNDGNWIEGVFQNNWHLMPDMIRPTEVNGDGLQDFVIGPDNSGRWFVMRSNGTAFVNGIWGRELYANYCCWKGDGARIRTIDVNGDGLQDILIGPDAAGNWNVLRSDGITFAHHPGWITGAYGNWSANDAAARIRTMDVNGDGLQDIVIGPDAGGNWFVLRSTGTSFVNDGAWITGAYGNWSANDAVARIRSMDVNGDGLQDIVVGPDAGGNWFVLRSTGTSFVNDGAWITGAYGNWDGSTSRIRSMDANGDGMQDIVIGPDAGGNWFVLRSTGTTFVNDGAWVTGAYGNWDGEARRIRTMDVDGDGLEDIVIGSDANGGWYRIQNKTPSERIKSIVSGANTITLSYKPITDNSVYAKDSNAKGTVMDLQMPIYVVSSVSFPNGIGGMSAADYRYGGLKGDRNGRGMLGFRWMEVKQRQTGMTTYTEYLQDWPYTGLPSVARKFVPSGGNAGLISETLYKYHCQEPNVVDSLACPVEPGRRYFTYLYQLKAYGWDLNGAPLPAVITTNDYDEWGNATRVTVRTGTDFVKATSNVYAPTDETNWILGRLIRSMVNSTRP